jgi:hypothetical protein
METVEIITGYWRYFFYFTFYREIVFIINPVLSIYYFEEKIEWNEKIT